MKQLNKTQTALMIVGGVLMMVATCSIMVTTLMEPSTFTTAQQMIQPWAFLTGALLYVVMQRMQTYSGANIAVHRLRSIQLLSGICFIAAGLLMIENFYHLVQPFVVTDMSSYFTYLQIVHNNWVVLVLVGAVLQMYTVHRIASELKKES